MPRILIVAYGNPLRCDDALAWRAADELEKRRTSSDVEIVRTHQLTPELAEGVSRAKGVIFVDAERNGAPGTIRCVALAARAACTTFSHQMSVEGLLELARQLFGAAPQAFSVTLAGACFEHGETLSPAVKEALPKLVDQIENLVDGFRARS